MAITWSTVVAGILVVFGLPTLIFAFNLQKKNLGWIVLFAVIALIIVGNIIENATR